MKLNASNHEAKISVNFNKIKLFVRIMENRTDEKDFDNVDEKKDNFLKIPGSNHNFSFPRQ